MKVAAIIILTVFVCSNATLKFVGFGGSDANNGLSFIQRWLTPQYAFSESNANRVVAGDSLILCSSSDNPLVIAESISVAFASAPTSGTPVKIIGGDLIDGTPYSDTTMAVITTITDDLPCIIYHADVNNSKYILMYSICLNGGGAGKAVNGIKTSNEANSYLCMNRCRITNCDSSGIRSRISIGMFEYCEIDNNGKSGYGWGIDTLPGAGVIGNVIEINYSAIHHNSSGGVRCYASKQITFNNIFKNGGNGYEETYNLAYIPFTNNTLFANAGNGYLRYSAVGNHIVNNVFFNNGLYGVKFGATTSSNSIYIVSHNCFYANSSGSTNLTVLPGYNIIEDPLFVDTTNNSEDFSFQTESPCKNVGLQSKTEW